MADSGPDALIELRDALRQLVPEHDWDWFHEPRNLAVSLIVEAAELARPFQWLTDAESVAPPLPVRVRAAEHMADVLVYLALLADKLDIDLAVVAREVAAGHPQKCPVERARGPVR